MLEPFGDEIWIADGGDITAAAGFRYPTRMAVIRLAGGGLFVWSPIPLSAALRAEVDALGAVRWLIAPNSLHHLFLTEWIAAYPGAAVHGPPDLRKKRADITFDADLGETPAPAWADDVDQALVTGNLILTEAVFFHRRSKTVVFTDLIQQLAPERYSGWRKLVAKLDLMTEPEPSVPRKFRIAFTDRAAARAAITRVLAWPAEKVLMAHGAPVEADGQTVLRRVFRWLRV